MRKIFVVLLILAIFPAFLMASGSASTSGTANSTSGVVQGTGVRINVYSNSFSDGRDEWLVDRAAKDGFKVQTLSAGAADVQNRLIAEKNAPVADVTFGLNAIIWETLVAQGVLTPYVPVWANEVSPGLNDPKGYYHAIVKQAILLCYDKKQMAANDAPKDWLELWNNQKFWNKYESTANLGSGTPRVVLAGILTRYADPSGDLGISAEGWKQIASYYEHGRISETGIDVYAKIADPASSVLLGQMWSSGIQDRDKQYGTNTGYVVPSIGVPFVVEGIAIVNGTKNMDEAKRFVDWFGSAQVQGDWAERFSTLPANAKAAERANDFNRVIANLPAQNIDWALVAKNIDAWCEKIQLNYLP
ncbi:MAG: extracellular solute-binding protein [Treponema sp.]|nr:extracellular solute-binding protein [Treponema sp.]